MPRGVGKARVPAVGVDQGWLPGGGGHRQAVRMQVLAGE